MKQLASYILLVASILAFQSCKKQAGVGGKASIKGAVKATFYCAENGESIYQGGVAGRRVYISYGGGDIYDDDVRTGTDGLFEFKYLNPGNYRISVISECDTCPSGESESSKMVEVLKSDGSLNIGEIEINEYGNRFCRGPGRGGIAKATGMLEAVFIDGNNLDTLGVEPALNERVFIIYGESNIHNDDVRTSADGSFQFEELRPGKYRIFAYSDCFYCPNEIEATFTEFTVNEGDTWVQIPKLQVRIIK